ncbi:MAG: threonine synthase [Micropepsaceae bacterium]
MRYISTRGAAPALPFEDVMLSGLAPDGGLYMPESWPQIGADEMAALATRTYPEAALQVLKRFAEPGVPLPDLYTAIQHAYASFPGGRVAPLSDMGDGLHVLELFHGPTFAFKDVALQLLGRLMDWGLKRSGRRALIVGATSGDTGSAAIAGLRGLSAVDVVILHPRGKTSDIQRRQMTTVLDENVRNLAVEGNFDDCQAIVKALFSDHELSARLNLAAVNSINWARIAAQIVYYVTAAAALGAPGREIDFAVPTGNFGDIFAGYTAQRMGAFKGRLIVATNENDILKRCLDTGIYEPRGVVETTSPSMDIQVSSNFERLLFEAADRDGAAVAALMDDLKTKGSFTLGGNIRAAMAERFDAERVTSAEAAAEIAAVAGAGGPVFDPHSAIGLVAARRRQRPGVPMIALATAHAAKFASAVNAATGKPPEMPDSLAKLASLPERYDTVPAETEAVRAYIEAFAARTR